MHWCKCRNEWVDKPLHEGHIHCKCRSPTFKPIKVEPIKLEPIKPMKFEPIKYEPIKYEPIKYEPLR